MPVSTSSPAPAISRLKLLGSGSGTITGNGAAQSLGSFTTTGDIRNSRIVIEIEVEKTLGNTQGYVYLSEDGATARGGSLIGTTALVNCPGFCIAWLAKQIGVDAATMTGRIENPYGVAGSISASAIITQIVLNAAEEIFLISNALAVGQNMGYRWRAYIEG